MFATVEGLLGAGRPYRGRGNSCTRGGVEVAGLALHHRDDTVTVLVGGTPDTTAAVSFENGAIAVTPILDHGRRDFSVVDLNDDGTDEVIIAHGSGEEATISVYTGAADELSLVHQIASPTPAPRVSAGVVPGENGTSLVVFEGREPEVWISNHSPG